MTPALDHVLSHIRKLVAADNASQWSDGQLLARFADHRDEEAFAALVHRHGTMVFNVCRRILHNDADAEDACQATFLVLARKSGTIRQKDSVCSWLHGVAVRTGHALRRQITRSRERDRTASPLGESDPVADVTWREVQTILDEEIERLPTKFKGPLLLCYLEGKAHNEGAGELGCSLTTFRGRLERARELLRQALLRRGISLPLALLAAHLADRAACAAMSPGLTIATIKTAMTIETAAAGGVNSKISALAQGVILAMFWTKLRFGVAAGFLAALLVMGGFALRERARGDNPAETIEAQDGPGKKPPALERGGEGKKTGQPPPLPENDPPDAQQERKKFAGAWQLASIEAEGKKLARKEVDAEYIRPRILRIADLEGRRRPDLADVAFWLSFDRDGNWKQQITGDPGCSADDDEGTSEIGPAKKPRTIDLKVTSKNAQAVRLGLEDRQGQVISGIYEFADDNTLRLSFAPPGKDRPGNFAAGPDSEQKVWVFRRVAGIDKAMADRDAWKERAAWSRRMYQLGYLSKVQADADQAKLDAAESTLRTLQAQDDEEKAVRAYVEELRAAVKMGNQQVYDVAIRPMFSKSVRWAARKGDDALVVELYQLYTGHPENAVPGGTALTWAAAHNDQATMEILLDRGLDVNGADSKGWTALHQAMRWGPANVDLLLKKGAKVNIATRAGETPLMLAAGTPFPQAVKMLLDSRAEVNAKDAEDRTALMYAAERGRLANARLLLGHGANVQLKDKAGRSALALVQAPPLVTEAPGFLSQKRAKELQDRAERDEKEMRQLFKSASGE